MTTPQNSLELLATLAAQRTARTDRLHTAVCALLAQLAPLVEPGRRHGVTVAGYTLSRVQYRTNVGYSIDWSFERGVYGEDEDAEECDPERPVGGEGYVHGDFNVSWRGPSRAMLIEFARYAGTFVVAFAAKAEKSIAALDKAAADIETANAQMGAS